MSKELLPCKCFWCGNYKDGMVNYADEPTNCTEWDVPVLSCEAYTGEEPWNTRQPVLEKSVPVYHQMLNFYICSTCNKTIDKHDKYCRHCSSEQNWPE